MKVAIAAYGAGNVRSVELALQRLGAQTELVHEPEPLRAADLAILPGVGSAATAMAGLRERGLDDALRDRLREDRPILGICLGLQLALDETEEDGGVRGLGLVPGRAVRLRKGRVPRIGWAPVEPEGIAYWFAHSYAAESPAVTGTSEGLAAVVEHGPFLGVQFHPEKSGPEGARFLCGVLDRCLSLA
ncbi:MAG TPA: imidazole glycerol phosphate synthase subunit HisH [Gaiellaceae bacterium]|nr:imidazole glycerol phosphate synthase subunit HisH [Gaiellaceae bacterium]